MRFLSLLTLREGYLILSAITFIKTVHSTLASLWCFNSLCHIVGDVLSPDSQGIKIQVQQVPDADCWVGQKDEYFGYGQWYLEQQVQNFPEPGLWNLGLEILR